MDKPYVELPNSKYHDAVILDEYNGKIGLCSGNTGSDDKVYMRWCYPQVKDKKPGEKSIPWKITIGETKEQAIATLEFFLAELKAPF